MWSCEKLKNKPKPQYQIKIKSENWILTKLKLWNFFLQGRKTYIIKTLQEIYGAFNKFPDFFVQAFKFFVDSWVCYCYTSYEMTDKFLWFHIQMHSYSRIHPTKSWLSQLVNFKNAIWHFRRTICNKILF